MAAKKPNDTPNQLLEREVIRATKPKIVTYFDTEEVEHEVKILPLPADALSEGANQLSQLLRPLISEFAQLSLRASSINRSEAGGESPDSSPADDGEIPPEVIEKLLQDFLKPESLAGTISQLPDVLKFIVEVGTDIDYKNIKDDIFVVIEFAVKVISHNIGPRLQSFLAGDYKRVKAILMGSAGTGQK